MAFLTMTYTFANSTTADASQVNTNFTDVIDATSDGTIAFNVAALTANGAVVLGASSANDLTVTASLASTVNIKTTRTYNIGSADLGLATIYLGGNSTHTVALAAASSGMSGDTSFILPTSNGTAYYILKTDGSGNTSWVPNAPEAATGADSDTGLTVASARTQIVTPTADRAYTLATTSVLAGDVFTITNSAALASGFDVVVKSSDGTTIATAWPQMTVVAMALQATPTGITHWRILNPQNRFQRKYLSATVNTSTTASDLTFSNLVIGKVYRVSGQFRINCSAGGDVNATLYNSTNGTNQIAMVQRENNGSVVGVIVTNYGPSVIFTAVATSLQVITSINATASLEGDGTSNQTYLELEECNNTMVTTGF